MMGALRICLRSVHFVNHLPCADGGFGLGAGEVIRTLAQKTRVDGATTTFPA